MNTKDNLINAMNNVIKNKYLICCEKTSDVDDFKLMQKDILSNLESIMNEIKIKEKEKQYNISLDSGELVCISQIDEAIKRIFIESGIERIENNYFNQELLEQFSDYLKSRNFSQNKISELGKEFLEDGMTLELKNKIQDEMVTFLKNNHQEEMVDIAKNVSEEELESFCKEEFYLKSYNECHKKIKNQTLIYRDYVNLPIIKLNYYDTTKDGLKLFGNDYGIEENYLNELINNGLNDEILNKIVEQLDKNNCLIGSEEEKNVTKNIFIEDIKCKLNKIYRKEDLEIVELFKKVYSEIGYTEKEILDFIDNAKNKKIFDSSFYKKLIDKINNSGYDTYLKIINLIETKDDLNYINDDILKLKLIVLNKITFLNISIEEKLSDIINEKEYKILDVVSAKNDDIIKVIKNQILDNKIKIRDKMIQIFMK